MTTTVDVAGPLVGLEALLADDASPLVVHRLRIGDAAVALDALLDRPVMLEFLGRLTCRACGASTPKSYGEGHCYACFKRLARCDLCVVSPDRCHYHYGTCREPEWGRRFCMTDHFVYLANSAGLKVGITREGNLPGRWLEQGATQGLVVMRTRTRHQAGCMEAVLKRHVADRTDTRALLRGDARMLDLLHEWHQLGRMAHDELARAGALFGADVAFEDEPMPLTFRYAVLRYPEEQERLRLSTAAPVAGRLLGGKGSYLLLDTGVFNVREHTSYHVRLTTPEHLPQVAKPGQLRLF